MEGPYTQMMGSSNLWVSCLGILVYIFYSRNPAFVGWCGLKVKICGKPLKVEIRIEIEALLVSILLEFEFNSIFIGFKWGYNLIYIKYHHLSKSHLLKIFNRSGVSSKGRS